MKLRWRKRVSKTLSNGWETDATWCPIAEISTKREEHAAVALNNHQCLVAGGFDGSRQRLSSVELYDLTTNTWTKLPDMKEKRVAPAAAVVGNVVHVIGGNNGKQRLASVEVLDLNEPPEQRQWTVLRQTMATRRCFCAAAVVGQEIYIMGGGNGTDNLSSVEIFNTEMHQWSMGPSMTIARNSCAAVAIGSIIYAIGGTGDEGCARTLECCNVLATGNDRTWTLLPNQMSTHRFVPAATVIGDCIIVVGDFILATAELWDPKSQKSKLLPPMSTTRCGGTTVTLGSSVLVMGGLDATTKRLSSGEQLHFSNVSAVVDDTSKKTMIASTSSLAAPFQTHMELDATISNVKLK